jgi:hypothetical protein
VVLSALAEGLDTSATERVFAFRQATITTWLTRASEHAHTLHEHTFHNLWLPHLQLDELRTMYGLRNIMTSKSTPHRRRVTERFYNGCVDKSFRGETTLLASKRKEKDGERAEHFSSAGRCQARRVR